MEQNIFDSWLCNQYIANRGLHNEEFPENSLGAYENAIKENYPIKLEVRLIGDGTVVCLNDDNLKRVCGKDKYASQITKIDLESCKLFGTEYTIPTLEETLNMIRGRTPLLIELKQLENVGELEKKVYDLLKDYKGEYAIQSINPFSLEWFKNNAPHIWRGQKSCDFKCDKMPFIKKQALRKLKFNKVSCPDFICYCERNLPNRFVKKYANLPLIAWTVRTQQDYIRVVQHSDNVIFENFIPKI